MSRSAILCGDWNHPLGVSGRTPLTVATGHPSSNHARTRSTHPPSRSKRDASPLMASRSDLDVHSTCSHLPSVTHMMHVP